MKNENRNISHSPLPGWGEAGRGAESWHVPDPAGQFASAYVGMGNNPVSLTDLDGMWAVGTYGGYSRMLAAVGRELALMYQDYYDWIDMFSLHKGFLHDVISLNYADGKSGMNSTNANGNQPDEQDGSDDPPKDEKKTNNNQDSNNWTFYSTVWGTLISEAARGNIPGLSMGFSVFGGGIRSLV
jgi:hypothetical protein